MTDTAPKDLSPLLNLEPGCRRTIAALPGDGCFDGLCELARRVLDCKAAVIRIVDRDNLFERPGLDPDLSTSAVMQGDAPVLENDPVDPRALANPLVAGEAGLRFFVGIPLRTADGHSLGILAVLDLKPRHLSETELDSLKLIAAAVVDMLELRLSVRRAAVTD